MDRYLLVATLEEFFKILVKSRLFLNKRLRQPLIHMKRISVCLRTREEPKITLG
jgi:hypothetical protein